MGNTNTTEKQLAKFSRQQAREAAKLRAAGLDHAAADLIRRASEAVEAVRSQARRAA